MLKKSYLKTFQYKSTRANKVVVFHTPSCTGQRFHSYLFITQITTFLSSWMFRTTSKSERKDIARKKLDGGTKTCDSNGSLHGPTVVVFLQLFSL